MSLARWSLLSKSLPTSRSSHCTSITNAGVLVIYGGEHKPRTPVDNDLEDGIVKGSVHLFDIKNSTKGSVQKKDWRTIHPSTAVNGSAVSGIPDARVGATMVFDNGYLYLWGGRGGVDMAPLQGSQSGFWRGKLPTIPFPDAKDASVHWEHLPSTNPDNAPDPRSYHCAVSHQGKIYIHAGCPTSGRLSSLHSFDIANRAWKVLADAPEPGRGGTALAVAELAQGSVFLRYGGFDGDELPPAAGTLDIYSVDSNTWHTVQPSPDSTHGSPGARSVHGFVSFQSSASHSTADTVALLYHGERDASTLGHAGAGTFWNDVWALAKNQGASSSSSLLEGWEWKKVDVSANQGKPEGRGWFPPAAWVDESGKPHAVLSGGLLSSNERSGELWVLDVE